jgi:hypothetical protein
MHIVENVAAVNKYDHGSTKGAAPLSLSKRFDKLRVTSAS